MTNFIQLARSPKQWCVLVCVLSAFVLANCTPEPNSSSDTEISPNTQIKSDTEIISATEISAETEDNPKQQFRDRFTDGLGQSPDMVVLPSGYFTMGSPVTEEGRTDGYGYETQRTVRINYQFAVSKHEVTVDEYRTFIADTGHSASGGCRIWDGIIRGKREWDPNLNTWIDTPSANWEAPGFSQAGNHPVTCVSWNDARTYIAWLNQKTGLTGHAEQYGLLTEAEWEYAARAGSSGPYPWGSSANRSRANYGSDDGFLEGGATGNDRWVYTSPVGSFPANAFGLYDMHGNAEEWVQDCLYVSVTDTDILYGGPSDGSAARDCDPTSRMARGGSWASSPMFLRSASRWPSIAVSRSSLRGFRLARMVSQPDGPESTAGTEPAPAEEPTRSVEEVLRHQFTSGFGEGPEMVVLPSGSFTMGSPARETDRDSVEGPQRSVRIGYEFAVGKYEVTFAEWDTCVADGGCGRYRPNDLDWGRGARPVINVSWEDAQAYVAWLNQKTGLTGRSDRYRLLTEAEWEYAALAGSKGRWSFGDDESRLGNFAWFADNSGWSTQPVGGKTANGFGLHDMHGNVWEWVEDCYEAGYSVQPSDGSSFTKISCSYRVNRGGSWYDTPQDLRSANRSRDTPGNRYYGLGFRLARTLPTGRDSNEDRQPPSKVPASENLPTSSSKFSQTAEPIAIDDSDVRPTLPPKPSFPVSAVERGLSGACDVRFNVDAKGRPYDVAASCTDDVFKTEAERAVSQAEFIPKIVDGEAVDRFNIVYPLEFNIR